MPLSTTCSSSLRAPRERSEPRTSIMEARYRSVSTGIGSISVLSFFFSSRRRHTRFSECDWSSDVCFFFFKQKTAYEISECDWSSDVCSSDHHEHNTYQKPEYIQYQIPNLRTKKKNRHS